MIGPATLHRSLAPLLAGLTLTVALAVPSVTQAQESGRFGVMVGANFATLRGLDDVDLDKRTGAMGGLFLVNPLGGALALQAEALVVTAGAQSSANNDDAVRLTYAQLPLLLRFSSAPNSLIAPHVYAGPYLGLKIACTIDFGDQDGDCDDAPGVSTKSVDVGGIVGGGLDVALGGLVLTGGVRYGFGVSKVAEFEFGSVRESAKNGSFAIYTGLSFRFGND